MTVPRDLLSRAVATPDAPALESAAGAWTFADLADRALRGAHYLRTTVPDGAPPVALLMRGETEFAGWFHALVLAGRVVLPLNLRLTAVELAQQLENARVRWLLGEQGDPRLAELASRVPGLRIELAPSLATLPAAGESAAAAGGDPDATRLVLYTSGTSGRAKGVCLSWNNLLASALAAEDRLGTVVRERWLACMPLFHVGGLSILVRSLLFGGPVRLQRGFDTAAVSDALDGGEIAGLSLVPTMLSRLLAHRGTRPAPPGLRTVLLGGAAATPDLVSRALAAGLPICPTYGLTEATSQVATAAPPAAGARQASPMRAVAGVELRILVDGRDAPTGTPGEILVRGPTVMRGYLHDDASSARALRDGWLHTGDVGRLDAMGALHVLDRRDDLVVSGGENVYPAEVEAVLLEHPAVDDAGVAGVVDDDLGRRVVAWIVRVPGSHVDGEALRAHCRHRLAGYKVPREFHFVDMLPRNAAGKLQRRRLTG